MKRIKGKIYLSFILLLFALTACTGSPEFELYEGESLNIAVVGEPPEVNEEQVIFTEISFDQMTMDELKSYDAVFIRENHLAEAAKSHYADIYINSTIPFFFIGTDNSVPFLEKDLEYNKDSKWTPGTGYTAGVLLAEGKNWSYGLYNDKKTDENIKEMYSRIFKTIDELNQV